MLNNLFTKNFKLTFILILVAEVLSFIAHQTELINQVLFILIGLGVLALSFYRLEYAFYILLTELFIGSKGYLFFINLADERISIRIAIFTAIFLGWFIQAAFKKHRQFFTSRHLPYYLAFSIFLIIGTTSGFLNSDFKNVFFDLNGWLYFLLAPIFYSVLKDKKVIENSLSILLSSASYLSIKTLLLLLAFSHQWTFLNLERVYKWVRDSGVGEITLVSDSFYRIFFQAHVYVLTAFFLALAFIVLKASYHKVSLNLVVILTSTTILASLSRSFWLGLGAGLLLMAILLMAKFKFSLKKVLKLGFVIIVMFILEAGFLYLITGSFNQQAITHRLGSPTEEAAASSRLRQLGPLFSAIKDMPLLGSGFGRQVSYISDDPRVRQQSPEGWYTTTAFEWGYLDIWLKVGLLGLLAYLCLIFIILKDSLKDGLYGLGIIAALTAVLITNIFSPYLNHPLGIGLVIWFGSISAYLYAFRTL